MTGELKSLGLAMVTVCSLEKVILGQHQQISLSDTHECRMCRGVACVLSLSVDDLSLPAAQSLFRHGSSLSILSEE